MSGPVNRVGAADIARMTTRLYLAGGGREGAARRSSFWVLLSLAAVIAGAGVVADSTATVIGAMIVAPLMTPILGAALAVVLADRRQIAAGVSVVIAGSAVVVGIAFLLGLLVEAPVVAATNSQVAGRVSPRLIDLVAALATGVVGAFAQVRSDVSDALPGVAIAISLVPPLSVVGLTLESGAVEESLGALLLFGTNVAAIVATGTAVLLGYRVRAAAVQAGHPVGRLTAGTLAVVFGFVVIVAVPLTLASEDLLRQQQATAQARPVAEAWAEREGWRITEITYSRNALRITALGLPPEPDTDGLRRELDTAGLDGVDLNLSLVLGGSYNLRAGTAAQPG